MHLPPSTQSTCPVINEASSDERNCTAAATSSGVPARNNGVSSQMPDMTSASKQRVMSVSTNPGATQFTRMPLGATSLASAFVYPITAALEAEYATSQEPPVTPHMEEIFTIAPRFCETISGNTALVTRNIPVTFVSITRCQSESDVSVTSCVGNAIPALLTSTSIKPNCSRTRETISPACASFAILPATSMTEHPACASSSYSARA